MATKVTRWRKQCTSFVRSRSLPVALSARAPIFPGSADGETNNSSPGRLDVTNATAGKRRSRSIERRVAGVYDDMRLGPRRSIDDERVAGLMKTTLHTKLADDAAHRGVRLMATERGTFKSSMQRYFKFFGLQHHRRAGFSLFNDPFFVEKLRVGVDVKDRPTCEGYARRRQDAVHDGSPFIDHAGTWCARH